MKQKFKVLIIEDHPLTSNAYKCAFEHVSESNKNLKFDVEIVNNCDDAIKKINAAKRKGGIGIVFLDIRLPPSKDGKIRSGEDLGIKIKKTLPNAKIIVSTTHNDNYRINCIIKSIDPDGFLVKNDLKPKDLTEVIEKVIFSPPYYTSTVLQSFRKRISNEHILDDIDRQLLYELSVGTKMKELPNILPMSMTGIERRKRHLKELFDIQNKDDRDLIYLAKEKGFI